MLLARLRRGETAWRMMTKRDPHGNIVRGTIAALAAAVVAAPMRSPCCRSARRSASRCVSRGASPATRRPFSSRKPICTASPIPPAGSGAIEVSDRCSSARRPGTLFQEIERAGGSARGAKGRVDPEGACARCGRNARPISQAGRLRDRHQRLPRSRRGAGSPCSALPKHPHPARRGEPIAAARPHPPRRALRAPARPERRLPRPAPSSGPKCSSPVSGAPPTSPRARASPKSLFEAGGIEAVEGSGDNLMKRFKDSGAKLACLCSSDKVYAGEAVNAAEALAAAGATHVYLAGKPGRS